jgi:hypothetical protein
VVAGRLRLTSGAGNQARAVYATDQQIVSGFTTTFTYTKNGAADGATFVIQRDPRGLAAIGAAGGALAYGGANAITPSVAFAINIYAPNALGTGLYVNGANTTGYSQSVINTGTNNAPITVTLTYTGGLTITANISQQGVAGSETRNFTLPNTLANILGGTTATVGFTAATGGSTSTQEITAWTFQPTPPPGVPTNLQGQPTGYVGASTQTASLGAHLTWATAPGATSYLIERKLTATGNFQQVGTSATPSFDDAGLAVQSTYFYRVRGVNNIGSGVYSLEAPVTTPAEVGEVTNLQLNSPATTSLGLLWTDNSNNEDGFQVLRRVGGTGPFVLHATVPPSAAPTPANVFYVDQNLTPGTKYDYRVQSYNLTGPSLFAVLFTSTLTDAPTGLTATPAPAAVNLAWAATPGADSYNVYRSTTPGGQGAAPLAGGLTSPSYSDTAVAVGTTYYYSVTATTLGGESNRSAEASAAPAGPVQVVGGPVVNLGETQRSMVRSIRVTFSGPVAFANNNPAAAFTLTRLTGAGGAVGLLAAVTADEVGRTVVNLTFTGTTATDPLSALNGGTLSLADGRYRLGIVDGAVTGPGGVALDGDGNGTAGGAYQSADDTVGGGPGQPRLYRLFGDATGNGVVDLSDLAEFRSTFNAGVGSPGYLEYLDADHDGVDLNDLSEFRSRFNGSVFP